jgi:hypothetical protein
VYAFDGNAFPNVPLIQARLGSVEEWNFVNHNNDAHPIHVHVNDFQVTKYDDPTTGTKLGPQMFGQDNANVPAPSMGPNEAVIAAGTLTMRTHFIDYLGLYVLHCHRLNHEDNGLMMLINVIPAISDYAVAVPGSPGHPAKVKVFDGHGDRLITTVTPFPDFYGTPKRGDRRRQRRRDLRSHRRRGQGTLARSRRVLRRTERRQAVLNRARALPSVRRGADGRRERCVNANRRQSGR